MKILLISTILSVCCYAGACLSVETQNGVVRSDRINSAIEGPTTRIRYKRPTGKELQILIQKLSPTLYLVSLSNVSDDSVYCVCLIGDTGEVEYFPYIIERKDDITGQFLVVERGGHFAPGYSAIRPMQRITFKFSFQENGIYRLKFTYFIDTRVVDALTKSASPSKDPLIQGMSEAAFEAITPEMAILGR